GFGRMDVLRRAPRLLRLAAGHADSRLSGGALPLVSDNRLVLLPPPVEFGAIFRLVPLELGDDFLALALLCCALALDFCGVEPERQGGARVGGPAPIPPAQIEYRGRWSTADRRGHAEP